MRANSSNRPHTYTSPLTALDLSTSESGIMADMQEDSLISTDSIEKHVYHDDSDSDHSGTSNDRNDRVALGILCGDGIDCGRPMTKIDTLSPFNSRRHDPIDVKTPSEAFEIQL